MNSNKREKVVAFIVVRLNSSRLYKKQLRKIGDKRLIDWTISSLKKSKFLDKIVITTTDEPVNYELKNVAKLHNIDIYFYKGSINDVVGRLVEAAKVYNADIPVLISGDCPLIPTNVLDLRISKILKNKNLDAVVLCQKEGKVPSIEGIGVYRIKAWYKANDLSNTPELREHHFPIIKLKSDQFNVECIECDDVYYRIKHRVSVDTLADLEFMNIVFNRLKNTGNEFNLKNLINLLIKEPHLREINRNVHQIQLKERPKKALFLVNDKDILNLFTNIAYDLTKKGIGVRFFTKKEILKNIIIEKGFGIITNFNESDFEILIKDNTT